MFRANASDAAASRPGEGGTSVLFGVGLLALSTLVLSCLDASSKWTMGEGGPLLLVAWFRYAMHLVLVVGIFMPLRGRALFRSVVPRRQVLRGVLMLSATLCIFMALSYLPQAQFTAIGFLAPLLVLCAAPWLLGERPRLSRWIAAGVAFLGVLVIVRPSGGLHPVGVLFALLAACLLAGQFIATRGIARDHPLTSLVWSGLVGTCLLSLLLPFYGLGRLQSELTGLPPAVWLVMLSTGFSGALGHLLQIAAYRHAPASMLAPYTYLQIVSATFTGWLIWRQFPDTTTWLGIAMICGSGVAIAFWEWRHRN